MELKELYVDSLPRLASEGHGARGSALCSDLAKSIPCIERRGHEAVRCTLTSACFPNWEVVKGEFCTPSLTV